MTDTALLYQTLPPDKHTFGGHPRALRTLFLTEMWERFSYYGMRALLILYMTLPVASGGLGFDIKLAGLVYGLYTSLVYVTAIIGGYLADRFLGHRKAVLIGGAMIAIGHFCLISPALAFFYTGLASIIAGTSLLKPNVSTLVGGLYAPNDARRDGAFSIFYMGINLGGFIGPLVCGYFAQTEQFTGWLSSHHIDPRLGWHFGLGAAGVGMTLGLLQFILGMKNFGEVGAVPPNRTRTVATTEAPPAKLTREEWMRLGAIFVFFLFSLFFWAAYEQAGSTLNLFADQMTDNRLLGWKYPSSWLQAVNSIFVIALAPVFAWLWVLLQKKNREPSSPAKFVFGLVFVSVSFFIVAAGALLAQRTASRVSPMWLIFVYLFATLGELCLSPVGLSTVTKLAPVRFASLMMGVWFVSLGGGDFVGGVITRQYDPTGGTLPWLFFIVAAVVLAAAVVLVFLLKPIRKLMAGIH